MDEARTISKRKYILKEQAIDAALDTITALEHIMLTYVHAIPVNNAC